MNENFDLYKCIKKEKFLTNFHKYCNIDLLVLGHPRCGSGYMAKFFNQYSLNIGHERYMRDGISCWMFAVNDLFVPFGVWKDSPNSRIYYKNKFLIHHLRDPFKAASSIILENRSPESYKFRKYYLKKLLKIDLDSYDSELEIAIFSYIGWNKIIELQLPDVVCRIESCHEDISEFMVDKYPEKVFLSDFELNTEINSTLNKYQKRVDIQTLDDLKKINFRNYSAPIISQKDWLSLPKSTLFILEKFCKYYKYDYIL